MIILTALISVFTILFNGGESGLGLLLLGPAAGAAFYTAIFLYYRNTNKRYMFEHETDIKTSGMLRHDRYVGTNNGTRDKKVKGENSSDHLKRVRRF